MSPQEPSMQQRLRAESANFDFAALLNGVSPNDAPLPLSAPPPDGEFLRPVASSRSEPTFQATGASGSDASTWLQETPLPGSHSAETIQPKPGADANVVWPKATAPLPAPKSGRGRFWALGVCGVLSVVGVFAITHWPVSEGNTSLRAGRESQSRLRSPSIENAPVTKEAAMGHTEDTGAASSRALRTGTMRLQMARTLTGPFSYWFVAASEQASPPQALPSPATTNGLVSLTIPAAYNHAGAHLRVLDQSLGKVARLPVTDFSHPEEVVEPQVGANVLRDEREMDLAHAWTLEKNGLQAQGTLQTCDALEGPVGTAGHVLRLEVSALGTQNWHLQCYQAGLNLQQSTHYQLAFWARADRPRQLSVSAILDKPDWHSLGLSGRVSLTPDWQKYVVPFTAEHCVPNHGRVSFLLGDAQGTISLAGITLRPGSGGSLSHSRAANSALDLTLTDFH